MSIVKFTVWGEPRGKGRHRCTVINGRLHTYTPTTTAEYEEKIRRAYISDVGFGVIMGGALSVSVDAYFSIPKSASKQKRADMLSGRLRPTKKPDTDNIAKVVFDALNKTVYSDDKQIVDSRVRKYYDDQPRIEVTITDLTKGAID